MLVKLEIEFRLGLETIEYVSCEGMENSMRKDETQAEAGN